MRVLDVPSAPGLHRINWDLRHGFTGPEATPWAPHDPTVVPRTLDTRGPFVSPGIYTVELEARGEVRIGRIDVSGDPDLPLTAEDYQEREAFLLEILDLSRQLPGGPGRLGGPGGPGPAGRYRRELMQLYNAINGGGVRQGTLHPPTTTQREQLETIKEALRRQGLVA